MEAHFDIRKGDLIEAFKQGEVDMICHGCNCFHTMGAGVAKAIATAYPQALEADKKQTVKGDYKKMGTYSRAHTINGLIINAYTQFFYGRDKNHFDPNSLAEILQSFNREFAGKTIGIPWIGCGLAGGTKPELLVLITNHVKTYKLIIYELD